MGRKVHKDRLFARYQRVNNHGTVLEDLTVHVWWEVGGEGEGKGEGGREERGEKWREREVMEVRDRRQNRRKKEILKKDNEEERVRDSKWEGFGCRVHAVG